MTHFQAVKTVISKEFRDSIFEDREPVMSGEEGLKAPAIVLAAYESAAQGRQVSLTPG